MSDLHPDARDLVITFPPSTGKLEPNNAEPSTTWESLAEEMRDG